MHCCCTVMQCICTVIHSLFLRFLACLCLSFLSTALVAQWWHNQPAQPAQGLLGCLLLATPACLFGFACLAACLLLCCSCLADWCFCLPPRFCLCLLIPCCVGVCSLFVSWNLAWNAMCAVLAFFCFWCCDGLGVDSKTKVWLCTASYGFYDSIRP